MRRKLAILCNLLVPGSGLILLRRDWLGLTAALLFGLLAELALLGWLIVPATIPGWLISVAAGAAVAVWLGAQWRLWVRLRNTAGPALEAELSSLRRQAAEAIERRQYAEALGILRLALSLNDEDPDCRVQRAELLTLMGRLPQARREWERVLQLQPTDLHRNQAREALASLPA